MPIIGSALMLTTRQVLATISGTQTDLNLATWLAANTAWNGASYIDTVVTLDGTALLKASNTSNYGLQITSADFPGGAKIVISMASGSRIQGAGGAGGTGGSWNSVNGNPGSAGGHAVYCNMGTDVEFQNANGEIWGGGGGGGGGSVAGDPDISGGGGGGGGAGNAVGTGGGGGTGSTGSNGSAGSDGTATAGGAGGNGALGDTGTDKGGAGGAPGAGGSAGQSGPGVQVGGSGGAAGKAIELGGAASPNMSTTSSPAVKGAIS